MASATVEKASIYRLAGRVGGYARAALYDGRSMTAAARQRFIDSFQEGHSCRLCPLVQLPADLLPEERQRRAEALRRGHYSRVALASAQKRAKKRTVPVAHTETAPEVGRHADRTAAT